MTLRKLTLSISLLAASLMLAAQAKAETWSCSFTYPTKRESPGVWVFKRKGDVFQILSDKDPKELTIKQETETAIYLFDVKQFGDPKTYPRHMLAAVLYKPSPGYSFTQPHFTFVHVRRKREKPVISIHGACVID